MTTRIVYCWIVMCSLGLIASQGQTRPLSAGSDPDIPHLRKQGTATQLIVDGRPFLALAGELDNDASTNLDNMRPIWPLLDPMNLNTVLPVAYWELEEPEEGKFDFSLIDGTIEDARRQNLHVILIWFGSWKNGVSNYAPLWAKKDFKRFPRAESKNGTALEVFSAIEGYSDATRDADARAFAALMRHLKEVDGRQHTVLMMQVENEVGILGDSRDRSPAANRAFAAPVPRELMDYLQKHKDTLLPEFRQLWEATGFKPSGTWEEVFGRGVRTDEIFMAWNYARYIGRVAGAGKAEYPLPMFVNAWLYHGTNQPGRSPSGGPLPHVMDVWKAAAPGIDMLSPDAYNDFVEFCEKYDRSGNPLFVPETDGGQDGAARALYAIGRHNSIGYTPFLIESNAGKDPTNELGRVYSALSQLMPQITDRQGKGGLTGVLVQEGQSETVPLGDYTMTVKFGSGPLRTWSSPPPIPAAPIAGALFVLTAPDEFYVIASGQMNVIFTANTPGPAQVGIGSIDEGSFVDGLWIPGRRLTNYGIGSLQLVPAVYARGEHTLGYAGQEEGPGILRVKLYRYQ